jgi:hypothetical protein
MTRRYSQKHVEGVWEFQGSFVAVPVSKGVREYFDSGKEKKNCTISAILSELARCVPVRLGMHTIVSNGELTEPCLLGMDASGSRTT